MKKDITTSNTRKPKIYTLELETYLTNVQGKADKISDKFVIMFFILGFCVAPVYDTWMFTAANTVIIGLLYSIARFVLNNKFRARMIISLVYAIFMLQFIGQMHGMAELHFFFFLNIALLIIYQDWRIMIPYTVFAIGHHSVLAILQANPDVFHLENIDLSNYFIGYSGRTMEGATVDRITVFQLMFHFGLAAMMAFICGWWAIIFRENSIKLMEKQLEQQAQNEELRSSEEELRQNSEELQSTNDQMQVIQREIEEKQKLLNKAEKLAGLASFEVDLATQNLSHSDNLPLIYGEDILNDMGKIIEITHPKDVHIVMDKLNQAAEGKINEYDFSYRSKGKNLKEYEHYRVIGEVINDAMDNPERLVGTVQNITEQVKQQQKVEKAYKKVQTSEEEIRQNYEELQATQEALVQTQIEQEKFVNVIKYVDALVVITDMEGKAQFVNEKGKELSGFGEDYKGRAISEFHNEQGARKAKEEIIPTVMQKGEWKGEHQLQNHNTKQIFDTLANVFVIKDPNTNQPISLATVQTDITERKKLEKSIKEQNDRLQASEEELRQNYEELQTTQEELHSQTQRLEQIFDGVPAMIYQFKMTKDGQMSFPVVSKGSERAYGLPPQIIMNDASSIISSIHPDDKQTFEQSLGQSAQTMTNWNSDVRVIINGKTQWIRGSSKPILDKEGSIIWSGIVQEITAQKQLELDIQAKNAELQASEEELQQNYEQLQITQELVNNAFSELDAQFSAISTTLGYVEMNMDRKVERVNKLFADWLDYSVDELQGKSHLQFIPDTDEDRERYENLWKKIKSGETVTDTFKRINKNGEEIWLYGAYCPVKNNDGEIVKVIKVASNYNEQKKFEKELQRLSLVASKTDNAVIITDKDGIIEWVNEGFTKISEYSFEEAIGKKPSTLLQQAGTDKEHIQKIREGLKSQKPFTQEIYNYSKSGRGYWLELNITPIFDDKNELVNFVAIESDITERKEATEKIQKQKERFDLAVSGSNDGVWDWDIITNQVYFSPRWKEMLGYKDEEIKNEFSSLTALLHPEDKELVFTRLNGYLEGIFSTYEVETRMKNKDGSWNWILAKGGALHDKEGKPIRMAGSHSDITQKKNEERANELRSKLLLNVTSKPLNHFGTLKKAIQYITEAATKGLDVTRVGVWDYEKDHIYCKNICVVENDEFNHSEGTTLYRKDFPTYFDAVNEGKVIIASDARQDIQTIEFTEIYFKPLNIYSLLDVPIRIEGKIVGVVCCEATENIKKWTESDISFMRSIADAISLMMQAEHTRQNELEIQEKNNALSSSEEELRQNLEELQSTQEELYRQKEEVEKSFLELQTTQSQLIQSEKMASLGQLVANIAHEINTPLGAIRSSAMSIEEILEKTLPTLPTFLKTLDDSSLENFSKLVQESSQKTDTLSSREKRTIKYDLTDELETIKVKNAEEYADWIVDMNMYKESNIYLPLLKPDNSKEIFYTAYQLSTVVRSNRTVKTATDRAAKIVFALKNFARQDQTGEKSTVNINESIETTLTLYHNQIKHGIDVTRDLGEIPAFLGYPDELIQVWTNIIHNALQAMENKGRLFIQTSVENNKALITIQDNGGGIPKEVQERVFDAFFTTKSAGEGSGLGLDITKKIIEKHDGKIWFETLEGIGTTFFIELPLN